MKPTAGILAMGPAQRQSSLAWPHFQIALQQKPPPKALLRRTRLVKRLVVVPGPVRAYTERIGNVRTTSVLN